MELPNTIYPAVATLIAAFLAAVYSFVSMLVSKDQKTTEFRQNWIDAIREELSQLLAAYGYLATQAERHKSNGTESERLPKDRFLEEYGDKIYAMAERFHRIHLRLNPKGKLEKQLLEQLSIIEANINFEVISSNTAKEISDKITFISQEFLKNEWRRVKRGELTFFIAKWFFLLVLVAFLVLGLGAAFGWVDLASEIARINLTWRSTGARL